MTSAMGSGIEFNYTAVLNVLFTIAGAALVWLTIRRGAKDSAPALSRSRT
jgi:hypothetical protein